MGDKKSKENAPKVSWFDGLKAEFAKIIWPEKKSLGRQTVTVVIISVILGIIIAILDFAIQHGVDFLINV